MIADELMRRLVTKLEADVHRHSWGQPPRLLSVSQLRPGVLILEDPFGPLIPPEGQYLLYLAEHFKKGDPHNLAAELARGCPQLVALAFVTEGWGLATETSEELAAAVHSGVKFADDPRGYELRQFTVIDIWGRAYEVHRPRGSKPIECETRGARIPAAMTLILRSLAPHLPEVNTEALDKLMDRLIDTRLRNPQETK